MKCKKCGIDLYGSSEELCENCKAENIPEELPRLSFVDSGRKDGYDNLVLTTLGSKEIAESRFTKILLGCGILILLTLIVGIIIFVFL